MGELPEVLDRVARDVERGVREEILNEFLLDGEAPLTQAELDEARREWQG